MYVCTESQRAHCPRYAVSFDAGTDAGKTLVPTSSHARRREARRLVEARLELLGATCRFKTVSELSRREARAGRPMTARGVLQPWQPVDTAVAVKYLSSCSDRIVSRYSNGLTVVCGGHHLPGTSSRQHVLRDGIPIDHYILGCLAPLSALTLRGEENVH